VTVTGQRIAVVVVALLAVAWLLVSYGNSLTIRHVQNVAASPAATNAEFESSLRDLRAGTSLDPSRGTETLSYEASIYIRLGRFPDALRALGEVVKREPDTAEAWFLIAQLSRQSDPARAAEARAQLRRLDPRAARGLR
jgi:cytochrome c-type biogenesis protein CcmH/NrfG